MHLYIKNMVCGRCVKVVKEELEKLNLHVKDIKLGEAIVEGEVDREKVQQVLLENGFELLEDKSVKLIEKIKTLIIDFIHHNKGERSNQNFSDYISRQIGKDYHYLSSLFSAAENITIEKYIIHQKIEKVKELLIYDELTLSEISYQLGYSSVAHLSNQFKQITGFTPTEFRKLKSHHRNPLDNIQG